MQNTYVQNTVRTTNARHAVWRNRYAALRSRARPSGTTEEGRVTNYISEPARVSDVHDLVMSVVAEKTGYPVELLAEHLELEADLGIDPSARVEILTAVRRTAPHLPDLDPSALARPRSLGEMIDRFAVATAVGAADGASGNARLARRGVRVVPAPPSGFALYGLRDGLLAIIDDGAGIAKQTMSRLVAAGVNARVYPTVPSDAYGVIHLGGLRDIDSIDAALALQREAFTVARAVARRFAESGGVFVTVQDTGGDFGISGRCPERAWLGGIAGLTRAAAREWPAAVVKAIDCERGNRTSAAVADAIAQELLRGGSTLDVGLRADGTRTTIEAVAAPVEPAPDVRIGPRSLIVATGGGRGVAARALHALARVHRPRLVLVGRTPLVDEPAYLGGATDEAALRRILVQRAVRLTGRRPQPAEINAEVASVLAVREVSATLAELRDTGAEVRYLAVDARDPHALTAALDDVRREWGPITGVVHAAGVSARKRIEEKTDEQFNQVFDTKVTGLRALLAATADDPLTVLCMFSSTSAHVGSPGQSDYAMANEVLNQVAHAQRASRPGLLVRSIAWGPWDGGMVGPALAEHLRGQGIPLIPVDAGARAFVAELTGATGDTHVLITAGDGASPFDGTAVDRPRAQIQIDARSHPYLADHTIEGTPVVPVALVLEWFTAAAKEWLPERSPVVIHDVSVLRKIGLERYAEGGHRLTVQGSRDGTVPLNLEVLGEAHARHYRGKAGLPASATRPDWTVPTDLKPVPPDIYDGHMLFHGPRFQAIQRVLGLSASGGAAVLAGAHDLGWDRGIWHTDPAAVDGGLQLAVLWANYVAGRAALPMGVAEYRTYHAGLYDGPTRCVVLGRNVWADAAECDVVFIGPGGAVRTELLGVSLVMRPERQHAHGSDTQLMRHGI